MRILRSQNLLSGPANFKVPAGQYAGFMLRASGVNQAAKTFALASMGNVTATWRGVGFMSVKFQNMAILGNHVGGVVESSSSAGAAFAHSMFIKASYGGDGNIFDITDDDDVYLTFDLSGVTSTDVLSGTLQLFGIHEDGAQAYVPKVFTFQTNVAASGSVPYDLPHDNIAKIFLNTTTNLSRLEIKKDRQTVVQATAGELLALSNFDSRVETGLTGSMLLTLDRSGSFDEALSDDITLTADASSGGTLAMDVVTISIDATPDVLARSRATLDNKVAVTRARKIQLGKGRAVKTANAIQGVA